MSDDVVINLGGQGELGPDVVDVNDFSNLTISVEQFRAVGSTIVKADIRVLPFRSGCADAVRGRNLPFQDSTVWAGQIAHEAFRILKSGGTAVISSRTGGYVVWAKWLLASGFKIIVLNGRTTGVKP